MSTSQTIFTKSSNHSTNPLVLLGFRDYFDIQIHGHQVIKQGISSQVMEPVSQYLGLAKGALAKFMDVDRGTAARMQAKGQNLPAHAAETLLRLLEIHEIALDVFVSASDAADWLRLPHPLLEGESPLDASKTSYGSQAVKNLLMSTKYGGAA